MSETEPAFVVAFFVIGGFRLAVDAGPLLRLEPDVPPAPLDLDLASSLGLLADDTARCGVFALPVGERRVRLAAEIAIASVNRSALFALPPLLEALEDHGLLGFITHRQQMWTLVNVTHIASRVAVTAGRVS